MGNVPPNDDPQIAKTFELSLVSPALVQIAEVVLAPMNMLSVMKRARVRAKTTTNTDSAPRTPFMQWQHISSLIEDQLRRLLIQ